MDPRDKNGILAFNAKAEFKIEFLRTDRNKLPLYGQENGRINDHISDLNSSGTYS